MKNPFKPGDKVHLRHIRKDGFELKTLNPNFGRNWAREETPKLNVNETYTVSYAGYDYVALEGYWYNHPFEKFIKA